MAGPKEEKYLNYKSLLIKVADLDFSDADSQSVVCGPGLRSRSVRFLIGSGGTKKIGSGSRHNNIKNIIEK